MVRKIVLCLVLLFLITTATSVLAYKTDITVITLKEHNVTIKILDPFPNEGSSNFLESFEENSGETGEITVTHSSSKDKINVWVTLSKNGRSVKIDDKSYKKVEEHIAGTPLVIRFLSGEDEELVCDSNNLNLCLDETNCTDAGGYWYDDVCNTEAEENETTTEVGEESEAETEPEQVITGAAVEGGENILFSKAAYIIIPIVLIALLVIIFIVRRSFLAAPTSFKLRKYSEIKDELESKKEPPPIEGKDKELLAAEKKIEEAQEEIRKIKEKKTKLSEARKKFEESKKELEELEKEEEEED